MKNPRLEEAIKTAISLGLSGRIVVSREYGGSTVLYCGEITIPKETTNNKRYQPLVPPKKEA
jgi:hypothetical protein